MREWRPTHRPAEWQRVIDDHPRLEVLTPRQGEIVRRFAASESMDVIADALGIKPATVLAWLSASRMRISTAGWDRDPTKDDE